MEETIAKTSFNNCQDGVLSLGLQAEDHLNSKNISNDISPIKSENLELREEKVYQVMNGHVENDFKTCDAHGDSEVSKPTPQKMYSPTLIESAFNVMKNLFSPDKTKSKPVNPSQQNSSESQKNSPFVPCISENISTESGIESPYAIQSGDNVIKNHLNMNQVGLLHRTPESYNIADDSIVTTVSVIDDSFHSALTNLDENLENLKSDSSLLENVLQNTNSLDLTNPYDDSFDGSDFCLENTTLKNNFTLESNQFLNVSGLSKGSSGNSPNGSFVDCCANTPDLEIQLLEDNSETKREKTGETLADEVAGLLSKLDLRSGGDDAVNAQASLNSSTVTVIEENFHQKENQVNDVKMEDLLLASTITVIEENPKQEINNTGAMVEENLNRSINSVNNKQTELSDGKLEAVGSLNIPSITVALIEENPSQIKNSVNDKQTENVELSNAVIQIAEISNEQKRQVNEIKIENQQIPSVLVENNSNEHGCQANEIKLENPQTQNEDILAEKSPNKQKCQANEIKMENKQIPHESLMVGKNSNEQKAQEKIENRHTSRKNKYGKKSPNKQKRQANERKIQNPQTPSKGVLVEKNFNEQEFQSRETKIENIKTPSKDVAVEKSSNKQECQSNEMNIKSPQIPTENLIVENNSNKQECQNKETIIENIQTPNKGIAVENISIKQECQNRETKIENPKTPSEGMLVENIPKGQGCQAKEIKIENLQTPSLMIENNSSEQKTQGNRQTKCQGVMDGKSPNKQGCQVDDMKINNPQNSNKSIIVEKSPNKQECQANEIKTENPQIAKESLMVENNSNEQKAQEKIENRQTPQNILDGKSPNKQENQVKETKIENAQIPKESLIVENIPNKQECQTTEIIIQNLQTPTEGILVGNNSNEQDCQVKEAKIENLKTPSKDLAVEKSPNKQECQSNEMKIKSPQIPTESLITENNSNKQECQIKETKLENLQTLNKGPAVENNSNKQECQIKETKIENLQTPSKDVAVENKSNKQECQIRETKIENLQTPNKSSAVENNSNKQECQIKETKIENLQTPSKDVAVENNSNKQKCQVQETKIENLQTPNKGPAVENNSNKQECQANETKIENLMTPNEDTIIENTAKAQENQVKETKIENSQTPSKGITENNLKEQERQITDRKIEAPQLPGQDKPMKENSNEKDNKATHIQLPKIAENPEQQKIIINDAKMENQLSSIKIEGNSSKKECEVNKTQKENQGGSTNQSIQAQIEKEKGNLELNFDQINNKSIVLESKIGVEKTTEELLGNITNAPAISNTFDTISSSTSVDLEAIKRYNVKNEFQDVTDSVIQTNPDLYSINKPSNFVLMIGDQEKSASMSKLDTMEKSFKCNQYKLNKSHENIRQNVLKEQTKVKTPLGEKKPFENQTIIAGDLTITKPDSIFLNSEKSCIAETSLTQASITPVENVKLEKRDNISNDSFGGVDLVNSIQQKQSTPLAWEGSVKKSENENIKTPARPFSLNLNSPKNKELLKNTKEIKPEVDFLCGKNSMFCLNEEPMEFSPVSPLTENQITFSNETMVLPAKGPKKSPFKTANEVILNETFDKKPNDSTISPSGEKFSNCNKLNDKSPKVNNIVNEIANETFDVPSNMNTTYSKNVNQLNQTYSKTELMDAVKLKETPFDGNMTKIITPESSGMSETFVKETELNKTFQKNDNLNVTVTKGGCKNVEADNKTFEVDSREDSVSSGKSSNVSTFENEISNLLLGEDSSKRNQNELMEKLEKINLNENSEKQSCGNFQAAAQQQDLFFPLPDDKLPCDPELVQLIQEQFSSNDIEKICSVVDDLSSMKLSNQILKASEQFDKSIHESFSNEFKIPEIDTKFGKTVNALSPQSFDFLSSIRGKPTGRDFSRESLYVKFDPLVQPNVNSLIDFTKEGETLAPVEGSPEETQNPDICERLLTISPQKKPDEIVPPLTPLSHKSKANKSEDKMERIKELQNEIYFLKNLYAEREKLNKTKMDDYESQIAKLTGESCFLEDKLKESSEREKSLVKKIKEQNQSLGQLKVIMEEYMKVISKLTEELETLKSESSKQMETLLAEKDSYMTHLQNTEAAFTDVHAKYEKSKKTIVSLKTNEAMFKNTITEQSQKLEEFKVRAREAQEKAAMEFGKIQEELSDTKANHNQETARLRAQLRKTELKVEALQESLEQKIKENQQLTAICDELIEGKK